MNPEQKNTTVENSTEQIHSHEARTESIENRLKQSAELSPRDIEAQTERARRDVIEKAASIEREAKETKKSSSVEHYRHLGISKKDRDSSYKQTMKQVQSEMSFSSRQFSKIIHNKAVENTSEFIGKTIARPNAILLGSIFAFVLTLIAYTVSKTMGYVMSGSETITAFIIGWIVGIAYDYLRLLFTGKN